MEKRFGVKDFLLFAVLFMVLISIWLMMFQVDRQWEFIAKVEKQIEEQSKDLSEIDFYEKQVLVFEQIEQTYPLPLKISDDI